MHTRRKQENTDIMQSAEMHQKHSRNEYGTQTTLKLYSANEQIHRGSDMWWSSVGAYDVGAIKKLRCVRRQKTKHNKFGTLTVQLHYTYTLLTVHLLTT